jgi:hypothetical protein
MNSIIDERTCWSIQMEVHIHYPRIWNAIQDWFINIDTHQAQVHFVFEHKNFFQGRQWHVAHIKRCNVDVHLALINDWSSSTPPDIYSFVPFIYNITLRGKQIELLIPCNQGNWIDCATSPSMSIENSKIHEHIRFNMFIRLFSSRLHIGVCKNISIHLSIAIYWILSKIYTDEYNSRGKANERTTTLLTRFISFVVTYFDRLTMFSHVWLFPNVIVCIIY